MSLKVYRKKRNFQRTPEPKPSVRRPTKGGSRYVIQRHDASHLHYDFRIEYQGVLKSWALPKGMPTTPRIKRLAVETEDHPLSYATFAGEIPEGSYGAGTVAIWDHGIFYNLKHDAAGKEVPLQQCFKEGRLELYLQGSRYQGGYALIHYRDKDWLVIKMLATTVKRMVQRMLHGDHA